ncbi:MAG: hypothetical protein CO020_01265 [Candidatus Colwellbacteria bacterium CG_4_9_14_0_2_um_filter_50_12]|uniref:High-affinity zinc uptake system membrane protein ZnuB n=1 Tax=Candidatus Colwellbacteria bacterium CG_4_9_14_0_2_um_filter_50_12 TaxID=1974538 RepID=A0A2M8G0Y5_9BACT|nr:MAG: hypothetical protein CO020_01265 [Candidatus Colwellbacteria bacterium CG_4_9_14_0_2_um_filter_50_12]
MSTTTNMAIITFITNNPYYVLLALSTAVAAGILGAFAVMRRMALASDPISHIALPGLGLALLLKINPLIGAAATLLVGALLIWSFEKRTRIATETLIGVVFSLALAIGSIVTSGEELIDALLGNYSNVSPTEFFVGIAVVIAIIAFLLAKRQELTLAILSPDLAKTSGVATDRLNLYFLLAFVATVLLGLRFVGVLLMGSLVIIPAAVAKNLARSMRGMITIGAAVAVASVLAGLAGAIYLHLPTGPAIVTVAAAIFILSLLKKQRD